MFSKLQACKIGLAITIQIVQILKKKNIIKMHILNSIKNKNKL